MNYLLLAAWMSLTAEQDSIPLQKVPDQVVEWCRGVNTLPSEEGQTYLRRITLGQESFLVSYIDKEPKGRSSTDVLQIEGKGVMYFDEGLDRVLDSGELEGVFFSQKIQRDYFLRAQERYSALVDVIVKSINQRKKQEVIMEEISDRIVHDGEDTVEVQEQPPDVSRE